MLAVFLSRAVPFVNLDIFSYVAGITRLTLWRFTLATLAGLVPYNFLIVYLGDRMAGVGADRTVLMALLVGGLVLAPVLIRLL